MRQAVHTRRRRGDSEVPGLRQLVRNLQARPHPQGWWAFEELSDEEALQLLLAAVKHLAREVSRDVAVRICRLAMEAPHCTSCPRFLKGCVVASHFDKAFEVALGAAIDRLLGD